MGFYITYLLFFDAETEKQKLEISSSGATNRGDRSNVLRAANFFRNNFVFNILTHIRFFRCGKGEFSAQEGRPRRSSPGRKILLVALLISSILHCLEYECHLNF